jgi:hypothetical protein
LTATITKMNFFKLFVVKLLIISSLISLNEIKGDVVPFEENIYVLNNGIKYFKSYLEKTSNTNNNNDKNKTSNILFNHKNSFIEVISKIDQNYINANGINSSECLSKLFDFASALSSRQDWALNVLDSFGKPPSGIYRGNKAWIGEYSECLKVSTLFPLSNWTSKYCTISKRPIDRQLVNPNDKQVYFTYGLCLPAECNREEIAQLLNTSN